MREENPDVLCLQETKCAEKSLPADITSMPEYPHKYWAGSDDKEGYSGVAMLCKTEPLKVTYGIGEYRSVYIYINKKQKTLTVVVTLVASAGF